MGFASSVDPQGLFLNIGYSFENFELLRRALTHCSYSGENNERLEFLGDSILGFVISSFLFEQFEFLDEGGLSRLRAYLVCSQSLCRIAEGIRLADYMCFGDSEIRSGGRGRSSILADAFEALLGAVFLDGGINNVRGVLYRLYKPLFDDLDWHAWGKDPKTRLQEYLQGKNYALPVYEIVCIRGPADNREFEIRCSVSRLGIDVTGRGRSKKEAEKVSAQTALEKIQGLFVSVIG